MSNVAAVTTNNFENEVLKSNSPVLVDFWAAWCGPCRMVAPVIDQLAEQYSGKVKVVKLNVDENPEIAEKYQILSIPTVYLFKNGSKAEEMVGARPKQSFEEMINKHV
ncbi:MAG: thioredoxin [Clostridia bacterium]|nr:thioredoxin [Clostridia bacterium]